MKLFVTDIDDTLIAGGPVPREVRDAFRRLREAGWDITVATGRNRGLAREYMEAIGVTQPAILCNGGRITDPCGHSLHTEFMEPGPAERILETVWDAPAEVQVVGDECVSCRPQDADTRAFYGAAVPVHLLQEPRLRGPVLSIGLWMPSELLEGLFFRMKERFGDEAEVCTGGPRTLDFHPRGVSKGSALELLAAKFLPVRPEVIVAAGDHMNDFQLLCRADVAAAPENACPDILEKADLICPPAEQGGIRALAEHLLSPDFSPSPRKGSPLHLV